jgi:hypothetical protein
MGELLYGNPRQASGIGATSPLPRVPATVPSQSGLQTFTSCDANRRFGELAIYALATRLRASWMEARATKAPRVLARFSKSLGETPVASEPGEGALEHPAAPQGDEAFMLSLRLTISVRSGGTFATAAKPARRFRRHRPRSVRAKGSACVFVEDEPGPSRSSIAAEWTATRIGSPSLSSRPGRLTQTLLGQALSDQGCAVFLNSIDHSLLRCWPTIFLNPQNCHNCVISLSP